MRKVKAGGGWPAIRYALRMARRSGGLFKFYRAMNTRNACKTCALGMGGQHGAMFDEAGRFPEVCKKSMQAMAADMQGRLEPEFFRRYGFDALRRFSPRELEMMGRLVEPVYAGPGDNRYHPIPWEEALERCIRRMKDTPAGKHFFYLSGRSSNEAAFLLQIFARLYGTNHVNNCSYYCHQASGVGLASVLGSGTATVRLEDLHHCDLVFLIGGNPASNHPRMMRILMDLRRRGGHVIVINPLVETGLVRFAVPSVLRSLLFGSEIASLYVQPHIGGDIALLTGIAKRIDEMGAVDAPFISHCTEEAESFLDHIRSTDFDRIESASGVSRNVIDRIAGLYAESQATVFSWTMGITHHVHGSDNVRAIANLAMLRGMVGRPHAGLLPIRGHSNVQGVGSVGVTPQLKEAVVGKLESHFGIQLPKTPGYDTLACMEAARTGELEHGWCLGGNLYGSNPDTRWAAEALSRLKSLTYFSTTLNTGHAWGRAETLILPVLARDEEAQSTTQESMFNYVRLSEGGPQRLEGPRGEVELIATLARGVLGDDGPLDWRSMQTHRRIREAIARIIPGYDAIGRIDETRREFHVEGRTFHHSRFATASGKARFHVTPIPPQVVAECELRLMTIRSEGQFNTVVYEEEDLYRHQERRDVILLSEADMLRLRLKPDQRVTVRSQTGIMTDILVRPFAIRPGNAAMYYPEANVLVSRVADPESRTPGFKAVRITLEAQPDRGAIRSGENAGVQIGVRTAG